jgi:hypothetical protein
MATFTPDKVSQGSNTSEAPAAERDTRLHTGPVARLLAGLTKWSNDYAHYQMDSGNWRNLAL